MKKSFVAQFEVKEITAEGQVKGYGSVFGVKDTYGDVVEAGAFKASLTDWATKGRSPAMLMQHNSDRPIGIWKSLTEDQHGLWVEGQLALKTRDGADAYEHLKAGTLTGLSIGYSVPKGGGEYDKPTDTFRLRQVNLWEVSPVVFPANPEALIETVKEDVSPRDLERILRDAGFSRAQAKGIVALGHKGITQRDAGADEVDAAAAIAEAFRRATNS